MPPLPPLLPPFPSLPSFVDKYIRPLTQKPCFSRGLLILFGALQPHYQFSLLQLHSASSITWIGGLQSFLLVSAGIVTGPIYDMGHQKTLIVTGGVLTVFGMMMLSLCTEYYQIILTQGLCIGLGAGLVNVPSTAMVAESFSADSRPVALALVNSGISVGELSQFNFFWLFAYIAPRIMGTGTHC